MIFGYILFELAIILVDAWLIHSYIATGKLFTLFLALLVGKFVVEMK